MTLEDFENWIINFRWEDPAGNLLSLNDYMKLAHIMIKHGISEHKTHPESEEDRAFLTLKYSEYIL